MKHTNPFDKYYHFYQPNEKDTKDEYGDCVIRALTKALDLEWLQVFDELHPISREFQIPFNCRPCYEKYLSEVKHFEYHGISNRKGVKRPTVREFAKSHKTGKYVLRVAHHLVAVVDGVYWDTWDCCHKSLYVYCSSPE